jgi:acyl-CoA reductase-like NAD-dependent aldehyde dehydrogenase
LKRVTLELGGNDAGIVLGDVDPKKVAPAIFDGAFQNSGQVCLALKRLYVHESVYDRMCDELAELANAAIVDDGLKQGTKLGPLQNKMQYEKVKGYLDDARANGKIVAGGDAPDRPGYFIRPTIVRDIAEGTRLVDEEQFGPGAAAHKILGSAGRASPRERNVVRAWRVRLVVRQEAAYDLASQMEAGTVWINKHLDILPYVPFGGAKNSGIGRELGEEGLAEFTQLQVINIAV